jgi:DNA-binding MarR family transcriptional regulator
MVDLPDWDLRLGYLIHDVSRLRRMMFDRALAPLGITRSQWWVLAFISRKDGLPQTQLANELDVGKVGVGALIDRLESSGFVLRQADPVDRRVKRVFVKNSARRPTSSMPRLPRGLTGRRWRRRRTRCWR